LNSAESGAHLVGSFSSRSRLSLSRRLLLNEPSNTAHPRYTQELQIFKWRKHPQLKAVVCGPVTPDGATAHEKKIKALVEDEEEDSLPLLAGGGLHHHNIPSSYTKLPAPTDRAAAASRPASHSRPRPDSQPPSPHPSELPINQPPSLQEPVQTPTLTSRRHNHPVGSNTIRSSSIHLLAGS